MKHFFTASITRTAICVVLLSVLPALFITCATGMDRYRMAQKDAEERGKRFVRIVAERQNQIAETTGTMAAALAQMQEVRSGNAEAASLLFGKLLAAAPSFTNIFLTDITGTVVASALPPKSRLDFSRQSFFRRTLRRDEFRGGPVAVCPMGKGPLLPFGTPVHAGGGEGKPGPLTGVLGVSLSLNHYDTILAGLELPHGAMIYLLDGSGVVAAAYPPSPSANSGSMLGGEAWRIVQNAEAASGHFFTGAEDRSGRLVAYQKLHLRGLDQPYSYVLYVSPEDTAYEAPRAFLQRELLLLLAAALFALFAAWALTTLAFLRPLHAFLAAATQLAGGNLSARVPEEKTRGEIGTLGREFNAMAEALGKRDRELSAARDLADAGSSAKSEFLANMSHEIRTPMNAVLGMTYLVLKTNLSQQQRGYLTKLLAAANSLLRVINDILDFSKLEAGKMNMEMIGFSLRRIVNTMCGETAARLAEKSLSLHVDVSSEVPDQLRGDPLRFSQALTTLVDEAVGRSERGKIFLSCSVLARENSQVTLQFTIRDASIGLTPMQLAEMKGIFESEDYPAQGGLDGSRLSLAICHRLFRMMDGAITVDSDFGHGATFTAVARFEHVRDASRQRYSMFEGVRALVVDDSEHSGKALAEVLGQFGFEVRRLGLMEQITDTLLTADSQGRPYALLFVDWRISFPDMLNQLTRIKNSPELKRAPAIIVTTAQSRAGIPDSLRALGLDAFLHKPINGSVLFDTLTNIISSRNRTEGGAAAGIAGDGNMAGTRVLVVEDNAVNRQIAEEILRGEDMVVHSVHDGKEAVALLGADAPLQFDMVLMDLQMPEMDGIAATRAIRETPGLHDFALPVIAMTAHADPQEVAACLAAGMNDHTEKPVTVEHLFATIRRWLPLRPAAANRVRAIVSAMREQLGSDDPAVLLHIEKGVAELLPYVYEGRVTVLRTVLIDGDEAAIRSVLDKLDDYALRARPADPAART